jgi:pimeloyl-ACP methyl ester carboxylesterase
MAEVTPPRRALTWVEPVRAAGELAALLPSLPFLGSARSGDGHRVLVLPGFTASDLSTGVLRGFLEAKGFEARPWGLGRNMGMAALREPLERRFLEESDAAGTPISIVGWSLGGLMGRALARRHPERVRTLVTLGSPLGGRPQDTAAWRLYQQLSPGTAQERQRERGQPRGLTLTPAAPVPTTAIYSRSDGVVPWQLAREHGGEQTENIEVVASHIGLGVNAAVLYAVADRLAQPAGRWAPFRPPRWSRILYPRID